MVPAVGQGAIAIEAKKDNHEVLEILKKLNQERQGRRLTLKEIF